MGAFLQFKQTQTIFSQDVHYGKICYCEGRETEKTASSNKKYAKFYSLDFSDKIPQNVKYNDEYT
jgi:hypothetical protein